MKAWIARDRDDDISIHFNKPLKFNNFWFGDFIYIPDNILPPDINPQWEDEEPIEIEIKIEKI
jgi:hypothetical protein